MNRKDAIENLSSNEAHNRLRSARYFVLNAEIEDEVMLNNALLIENVSWIKNALKQAISNLHDEFITKEPEEEDLFIDEDEFSIQVYSIAVEETTRRLVHEIEPILGQLRVAVIKEVEEHENSKVMRYLNRLDSLLEGINTLSKAAANPNISEVNLSDLILKITQDEIVTASINKETIELVGKTEFIVYADPDLIYIIFCNGLKNAIESLNEVTDDHRGKIVVNWGDTDIDYYISIIDSGIGLPIGKQNVWDIGTSNKKGHLGMGLPTARQAARSLDGEITLNPRNSGGVVFEFRWPLPSKG